MVSTARDRSARVSYLWPPTLRLPARPPKLVYLDLNHWIALAKANAGHRDGQPFADALAACVEAVERRVAVFPIADTIYMEVSKIGQYRQRRDLREVIERVSRYMVVTSRVVVAEHEVEALLDRFVGPSRSPINTMDYIDWGVARAFGMVGGFRIRSSTTGEDITQEVRSSHRLGPEEFDRRLAAAELGLNRSVLEGPASDAVAETLRQDGWNPRAGHEVAERRAQQEREQVERFIADSPYGRYRGRDVVTAREVAIEINEILWRGLHARGTDLEHAFTDPDAAREALATMPSVDVSVTLKTSYHQDPAHRWTANDIHDIDAVSSTIPYCDVVVTDKAVVSHAQRTGLAERLDTAVLARLSELVPLLA